MIFGINIVKYLFILCSLTNVKSENDYIENKYEFT